jgi:hypothetical protein
MKKILSLTLLLMMSLAIFTFLPARAEDDTSIDPQLNLVSIMPVSTNVDNLEKIPSPDQLKYFKVMKKENGALYGVRINNMMASTTIASRITENNNTGLVDKIANLEKILTPQFIGLYEKVQKIGTSLWGVKKGDKTANNSNDNRVKAQRLVTADITECVSKAIDAKDAAMITLTNNSAEKIVATINARGLCQKAAIASIDNQAQNLKDCIVVFQKAHQEIVTGTRQEQKDIWVNYQTETKACAVLSSAVATDTELIIDDGGNNVLDTVLE